MSSTAKKNMVRSDVALPSILNKRVMKFMEDNVDTGRVPNSKKEFLLECIKVGFEQIADNARDERKATSKRTRAKK